jgi:Xaa-Pro aminopeptidase
MSKNEVTEKLARMRALMAERDLEAIILKKGANIAWAIGGRAHVPTTLELACMDVVVTPDGLEVITNKIEADRLKDEELSGLEKVTVINWFEGRDGQLPHGERIGIDGPDPVRINLATELETLRRDLNQIEVARFREICTDSAIALGDAMRSAKKEMSEVEFAGVIARECWSRDLEPVVLLVAGQERIVKYRHPLPTTSPLGSRFMGVICTRRKGLIASVTRIASFAKIDDETKEWYDRLLDVERVFINESKVGAKLSDVVKKGVAEYRIQGFDSEEWTRHHQGGPTGYLPRDFPAHEKSDREITTHNALAWNPSGKGLKVEDTILTTPNGAEVLTIDPKWPTQMVFERARPALLEL